MKRMLLLLLLRKVLFCQEITRSKEEPEEDRMVIFEHAGVMKIYDLREQEIVEEIVSHAAIQDKNREQKREVNLQSIGNKRITYNEMSETKSGSKEISRGVNENSNGVMSVSSASSNGIGSGIIFSSNSTNTLMKKDNSTSNNASSVSSLMKSLADNGNVAASGVIFGDSLPNLLANNAPSIGYSSSRNDSLPTAIVSNGMVVSRDKRIAVEYIASAAGVIVFVYNETVSRVFRPSGILESVEKKITSILHRTRIDRTHAHHKIVKTLLNKYKTDLYILKKIDGLFYFSEIFLSEIKETHRKRILKCLDYSLYASLFILMLSLLSPMIIRIVGYKDTPITLLLGKCTGPLRKGFLFGKKRVKVLVLHKNVEKEKRKCENIMMLREHNAQDGSIHTEETEEHCYIAYSFDTVSLSEFTEMKVSQETIRTVGKEIINSILHLYTEGFVHFTFSMENILINTHTNRIVLLGVEGMAYCAADSKRPSKFTMNSDKLGSVLTDNTNLSGSTMDNSANLTENGNCAHNLAVYRPKLFADYVSLGEVFYGMHKDTLNEMSMFKNKSFSESNDAICAYNYRKHPQFIIGAETKYQIELLDWIASLLSSEPFDGSIIHPFFWTNAQSLEFLSLLSDFIFDNPEGLILESSSIVLSSVMDLSNWDVYLDVSLLTHLTRGGRYYYNTKVLRDLFRLIRNNGRHFQSIPEEGRLYFNNEVSNYSEYFLTKYPQITLLSYYVAQEYSLLDHKIFSEIFKRKNI
ncbi:hypothetical protein NEMIN01_2429 [Nematocida minor]|uniref:uncharacterized protein n=1 Tax=Nematocida minor TaxID=1912983 RepID=UPI00221F8090|nr:uncharacterized protein NEMIN01_2429 [Nematocida minor]KAI5193232.1 hypothetical protein NEMIN01_2429 [Nematocida minor]